MTPLALLGMVAALAFGVYWGLATPYRPDFEEIDEALVDEGRSSHRVERKTTFLTLMQRTMTRGSHRRRGRRDRQPFRFEDRAASPPPPEHGAGDSPPSPTPASSTRPS